MRYDAHRPELKVRITDPFWTEWQHAMIEAGLPHQWAMLVETGRIGNFHRAARGETGEFKGYYFNDSDVYKWLEAAAYALALDTSTPLSAHVDEAVQAILSAQLPDGYVNTYFQITGIENRLKNLSGKHEMYCAGHLIEAGVALFECAGRDDLLNASVRFADLLRDTFGPGKRLGYPGHPELELALVRLAKATGDQGYRDFARWLVEARGSRPSPYEQELADPDVAKLSPGYERLLAPEGVYSGAYAQDDLPFKEQTLPVGHAVRAMYLYAGACDACDDPAILDALERIWESLVEKRMYVTGGIGSSGRNEGFTLDYDLPNRDAYSETCAAIGLVMWASRMAGRTGEGKYADVMELALYNAALAGVNFDTDRYFYVNPLESPGGVDRKPWFDCACCPPNIARLILSLDRYVAHLDGNTVTIDLPIACEIETGSAAIRVQSEYPWEAKVQVDVTRADTPLYLTLRQPGWCEEGLAMRDYAPIRLAEQDGYLKPEEPLKAGSTLTLAFKMEPQLLRAHPNVADAYGKIAVRRGPLVYCLETDQGAFPHLFRLDPARAIAVERHDEPRWGATFTATGSITHGEPDQPLYANPAPASTFPAEVELIPYFAWCNRGPGGMSVWLNAD